MWRTVFFVLFIFAESWAFGEDELSLVQSPPPPQPPMAYYPRPLISASEKANHLRLAAAELEAAGLNEEAARFRQIADAEHPASKTKNDTTVLLKLTLMEVSLTKLRKLGLEAEFLSPEPSSLSLNIPGPNKQEIQFLSAADRLAFARGGNGMYKDDDKFLIFLKKLREDGLAKVIAEPKMAAMNGQSAHFHLGGETVVAVPHQDGTMGKESKKYGTQVDFLPTVLDGDTINIKVKASIGDLVYDYKTPLKVDGKIIPVIASSGMDTACTTKSGQVLVVRGPLTKHVVEVPASIAEAKQGEKLDAKSVPSEDTTELLILLKPEIVEPMK